MFKKHVLRQAVAAAFIAASAFGNVALAQVPVLSVSEFEPNGSVTTAQHLNIPASGEFIVNGSVGDPTGLNPFPDVDFYSFDAGAGSVITLDLDDGYKGTRVSGSIDAMMAIYGPAPDYKLLIFAISGPADPGSTGTLDPWIGPYLLNDAGTYTIAVTTEAPSKQFLTGGIVANANVLRTSLANGTYKLSISGVKPAVQIIGIDIKPGSTEPAPVNLKAKGSIPVALLSSATFNALDIVSDDPKLLTFGSAGTEQSLRRCGKDGEDVDGDGRLDLVCHFDTQASKFKPSDAIGTVIGQMKTTGMKFMGKGDLKVVPVPEDPQ